MSTEIKDNEVTEAEATETKEETTNVVSEQGLFEVESNIDKSEDDEPIKWESLVELHNDTKETLGSAISIVNSIGEEFKDIINSDKEMSKIYIGVVESMAELTTELFKILKLHSKAIDNEKDENGNIKVMPFVGEVDISNDKHQQFYLNLAAAYNGLTMKIANTLENTTITLLGMVRAKAEEDGIDIKDKLGSFGDMANKKVLEDEEERKGQDDE